MKKIIPLLLMAIMLLAVSVYATCQFNKPTDTLLRGSAVFNLTCDMFRNLNCTITGSSSAGTTTFVMYNNTPSVNYTNATIDTTGILDASDWTFSGTCTNNSNTETVAALSSITIDNTVPTCAFDAAFKDNTHYTPNQAWSVTGINATSATLQFGSNSPFTMTESSDVFSYTGNLPEAMYDTVTATTSDGLNTTNCMVYNIQVDQGATPKQLAGAMSGSAAVAGAKMSEAKSKNTTVAIVIGAVALYMIMRKKK